MKQNQNLKTGLRSCLLLMAIILPHCCTAFGQAAVALPVVHAIERAGATRFEFVSDGPLGSGWGNTNKIARVYFHEDLPAFFRRTIVFTDALPKDSKLLWIFTGKDAGVTITLSAHDVVAAQRFYNSYALFGVSPHGNFPEKIIKSDTVPYTGIAQTLTVVLNSHLALEVWVNGRKLIEQSCLFDVSRSQLMFDAPRSKHDVLAGALEPPRKKDA